MGRAYSFPIKNGSVFLPINNGSLGWDVLSDNAQDVRTVATLTNESIEMQNFIISEQEVTATISGNDVIVTFKPFTGAYLKYVQDNQITGANSIKTQIFFAIRHYVGHTRETHNLVLANDREYMAATSKTAVFRFKNAATWAWTSLGWMSHVLPEYDGLIPTLYQSQATFNLTAAEAQSGTKTFTGLASALDHNHASSLSRNFHKTADGNILGTYTKFKISMVLGNSGMHKGYKVFRDSNELHFPYSV